MGVMKLLIVENNTHLRRSLKCLLLQIFHKLEIYESTNMNDAKALTDSIQPDVVLTNMVVEGDSGLFFAKQIVNNNPGIQIMLVTRWNILEYRKIAREISSRISIFTNDYDISEILRFLKLVKLNKMEQRRKQLFSKNLFKVASPDHYDINIDGSFVLA